MAGYIQQSVTNDEGVLEHWVENPNGTVGWFEDPNNCTAEKSYARLLLLIISKGVLGTYSTLDEHGSSL